MVDRADEVSDLERIDEAAGPLTHGAVLFEGRLIGVLDVPALLDTVSGGS